MRKPRSRSFRSSLVLNLLGIVMLFALASSVLGWLVLRQTLRQASQAVMAEVVEAKADTHAEYYDSVEKIFVLTEFWVRHRWNGAWDTYEFDKIFAPSLLAFADASALYLAREQGDLYVLGRTPGGWVSWTLRPVAFGERALVRTWTDRDPAPEESWQPIGFDVGAQPWFAGAIGRLEAVGVDAPLRARGFEAEPRANPTTGLPGRVLSFATRTELGDAFVFGFEQSLARLTERLQDLQVLDGGVVAVVRPAAEREDGLVFLGVPADPGLDHPAAARAFILRPPRQLGGPIADFVEQVAAGRPLEPGPAIRFESRGEPWWGMAKELRQRVFDLPSGPPSWVVAAVPEADLVRRLPRLWPFLLAATAVLALIAAARAIRLSRTYSAPIDALVEQSRRLQRLDFSRPTEVRTEITEIGILAGTLESARRSLGAYASISEEVRIADAILRASLPAALPRPEGFEIEASWQPAEETGGEMFDVVAPDGPPDSARTALMLLVPEGFGVEAAVLSAQLRAVFRAAVRARAELDEIVRALDTCLARDLRDAMRVDGWFGLLEPDSGRLVHLAPGFTGNVLHRRADAATLGRADSNQPPLGRAREGRPSETLLEPGDVLIVASHGIVDAMSTARERFGTERLATILRGRPDRSAAEIVQAIEAALTAFVADRRQARDRTLLVVRRMPVPVGAREAATAIEPAKAGAS
ncbi:MAG: serine/threonine-protein phosphatase [Geminicoccaceae bacterium]|nr:serine/threonine-protein phosphatase [Geminicoccaceae bacterium]